MSQASVTPTDDMGVLATATHDAPRTASTPPRSADSAGDEVTVPSEPSTPSSARIAASQTVLARQAKEPRPSGGKSNFRLLYEASSKCIDRLFKEGRVASAVAISGLGTIYGLGIGLVAGLCGGFGSWFAVGVLRRSDDRSSFLSSFLEVQEACLVFMGMWANTSKELASEVVTTVDRNTGEMLGWRHVPEFLECAKDQRYEIGPATFQAGFGLGAAIGAAVPTVLVAILHGPSALYMAAKEKLAGGETPPPVADPPTAEVPEQVGPPEIGAEAAVSE